MRIVWKAVLRICRWILGLRGLTTRLRLRLLMEFQYFTPKLLVAIREFVKLHIYHKYISSVSWKILIIVDNVYKGFSFIVWATSVTLILIATFRPHTAGLHQAIVSIYWVELFILPWLLVMGVSQTSLMVGGFRSKALLALWEDETDPSAVRYGRGRCQQCFGSKFTNHERVLWYINH